MQRLEAETKRREELDEEHKLFELESLARKDVEEYIKDCKIRRRKSLASRAKEKMRHAEWEQKRDEAELVARMQNMRYRTMDLHHLELAKQKERANMALDALRAAGCTIKGNPFAGLLDL